MIVHTYLNNNKILFMCIIFIQGWTRKNVLKFRGWQKPKLFYRRQLAIRQKLNQSAVDLKIKVNYIFFKNCHSIMQINTFTVMFKDK